MLLIKFCSFLVSVGCVSCFPFQFSMLDPEELFYDIQPRSAESSGPTYLFIVDRDGEEKKEDGELMKSSFSYQFPNQQNQTSQVKYMQEFRSEIGKLMPRSLPLYDWVTSLLPTFTPRYMTYQQVLYRPPTSHMYCNIDEETEDASEEEDDEEESAEVDPATDLKDALEELLNDPAIVKAMEQPGEQVCEDGDQVEEDAQTEEGENVEIEIVEQDDDEQQQDEQEGDDVVLELDDNVIPQEDDQDNVEEEVIEVLENEINEGLKPDIDDLEQLNEIDNEV